MRSLGRSFLHAMRGFADAFFGERNLKIHTAVACIVLLAGIFFRIDPVEWAVLFLTIGGMFAAELLNTAIERLVNLVQPDYHPLARQTKDIAAAACLFFAVVSVAVGVIIFLPKLAFLFRRP